VSAFVPAGRAQYLTDPNVRSEVPTSLAHHLGLDIPSAFDGAS
jgi:hypothetical protein